MNQRRYDIDALRSIAMFLLIFYHLGVSFTSVAPQISFVQNKRITDGIWPLLNLMNSWRIPLVFLIAGVALRLSFRKRTKMQIFKERAKVLGLPWLFGTLVFSTSSIFIAGKYYDYWFLDEINEAALFSFQYQGIHLWFLINIFIYCWLFVPILNFISKENFISSLLNRPGGIFLFAIPIIAEGHLLNLVRFKTETYGDYYTTYALTEHGFILGLLWFAIGIILTSQGDAFWESNKKNWRLHLALGMTSYFYRLFNNFIEDYALDNRLIAFESFNFIFALLGLAAVYLNKDSPQLTYYKTAVYPVYIVHLPVQMAVMYFFAGINIHPIIKFPIALFLICFLSLTIYHAIKNIKPLRPLFGLRNK
jgi:surface polysaccharide O-acyltransferase-like enzyme